MVVKACVCGNDETAKDDKTGDNEVEECAWVPGELKSVFGLQGTLVSLRQGLHQCNEETFPRQVIGQGCHLSSWRLH
jgi:hypothetical protein